MSLNSKRVAVDKIYFGDIDARSEITSRDPEKRSRFVDAFSVPASLNFNQVLNGERFLIVGPKGSGKTAFLRYLDKHLDGTTDGRSRFIIFRDDVTDQDRTKLVSLSDFRYYDSNSEDNSEEIDSFDCLNAWQLFIHREIAYILKNSNDLVGMTPEIGTYIEIVNKVFSSFTTSGLKQILQKINKGKLKLWGPGVGLEAELEFFDKHGNVDVSELVRYCNHVASRFYFNQHKTKSRINIFFDEVNINFVSGRAFKRNAVLVRDLVAACAKMNALFAENQVPVYVYTALRSEVVDSVEGSVRELQKLVDDKAVHINWVMSTSNHDDQPLIQLLRKRIFTSVRHHDGGPKDIKSVRIEDYFSARIHGHKISSFLIFETWGRPRDLVRMLTLAAPHTSKTGMFTAEAFDASLIEYSRACWEEKGDELNSKYSLTEIGTIKRLLSNFAPNFSRIDLDARISLLSNRDSRSNHFFLGRNVDVLLEDLFKVGVIGNILKTRENRNRPAYLYTGHRNFTSSEIMCVHRSLWRELGLEMAAEKLIGGSHKRGSQVSSSLDSELSHAKRPQTGRRRR